MECESTWASIWKSSLLQWFGSSPLKIYRILSQSMEGLTSRDILGCLCVRERALLQLDSELPHTPTSEPVSQPSRAANHWHTGVFPNPAPEWPNDWKSHLGGWAMKGQGSLRLNMRLAYDLTLLSCWSLSLSTAGTQKLVAICVLSYIFSIFFSF